MKDYDLVIVGVGPIGIACGLAAKKKNLSYVILEKGPIVNSLFHYPKNMQFFSSSEKLEIDAIPFISKEAKPRRDEALEYYRRIVTTHQLKINLFEHVEKIVETILKRLFIKKMQVLKSYCLCSKKKSKSRYN